MKSKQICIILIVSLVLISLYILCSPPVVEGHEGMDYTLTVKNEDEQDATKHYRHEEGNPLLSQLELVTPDIVVPDSTESEVAMHIKKCDDLNSATGTIASKLDNNEKCGYCFGSNKLMYGDPDFDRKRPTVGICNGKWVYSEEEYTKHYERTTCRNVKNCNDMEELDFCAWCPELNTAVPYKIEKGGKIVPKYDEDSREFDSKTLIKGESCKLMSHPCYIKGASSIDAIPLEEITDPDQNKRCIKHLWESAGCNNPDGTRLIKHFNGKDTVWNNKTIGQIKHDMGLWNQYASSTSYDRAKTHYKGCYGRNIDPCSEKYKSGGKHPLDCYKNTFKEAGCLERGSKFPTTVPTGISLTDYTNNVQQYVSDSHDMNKNYDFRNNAYKKCYNRRGIVGGDCVTAKKFLVALNYKPSPEQKAHSYNVSKEEIEDILTKAKGAISSTKIATKEDIINMGKQGISTCQYGWFKDTNGDYAFGLSSIMKTTGNCGGRGTTGINIGKILHLEKNWGGEASVYVTMNGLRCEIPFILEKVGIQARIKGAISRRLNNYTLKDGHDCIGSDIKRFITKSNEECANKCDSVPTCKAFVTSPDGSDCWLKSDCSSNIRRVKYPRTSFIKK